MILGVDVADVRGPRVEVRELERTLGVLVDIGQGALSDAELVDLQGIDRLDGSLPALAIHRHLVGELAPQLGQVHVRDRPVDREVGDELQGQKLFPVHARVQSRNEEDRGLGVRRLADHDIVQRERKPERLKPRLPDARGVALEAGVHPAFDGAPERLVGHEAHGRQENDQAGQRDSGFRPRPHPPATPLAPRRRNLGLRLSSRGRAHGITLSQAECQPARPFPVGNGPSPSFSRFGRVPPPSRPCCTAPGSEASGPTGR